MNIHIGFWDILLIIIVTLMSCILAYLPDPRWKAFLLSLPIPFTIAVLAVGRGVDATNAIGLLLLCAFMHAVRILHNQWRVPILLAIFAAAAFYCITATSLVPIIPHTDAAFWIAVAVVLALAIFLMTAKRRDEPHYRTPLPIWIKLPAILTVVIGLVLMKSILQNFMTVFPMVSTITVYETRHSLYTTSRQMPVVMLTMLPILIACRLVQDHIGLPAALACGWLLFGLVITPISRLHQNRSLRFVRATQPI
jgi:hypothetical protein